LWFSGYELEHQNTATDFSDDLYFLHARWYHPYMMRFLSPDPLRGDPRSPQSLNLFAYVTGNPRNFVDPWGLAAQEGAPGRRNVPGGDGECDVANGERDPDCWSLGRSDVTSTPLPPDLSSYSAAQDLKNYYAWLARQERAGFMGVEVSSHGFVRQAVARRADFVMRGFVGFPKIFGSKLGRVWFPGAPKLLRKLPSGVLVTLTWDPGSEKRFSFELRAASGVGASVIAGVRNVWSGSNVCETCSPLSVGGQVAAFLAGSGSLGYTGGPHGAFIEVVLGVGAGASGFSVEFDTAPILSWSWP
ncbi:MAG: RHS repeat-associated core domain-containing protein, partial [Thermoanaerobaculum sp.]